MSVLVPTRNRASFLEEAVESVLGQTYRNLECIVVDGGSTDSTRAVLDGIDDERLRVRFRDRPHGLSNARNVGLELASGEYVVFLDDDDRLFEDAIERLVDAIRDRPSTCAGVYTAARTRTESGETRVKSVRAGRVDTFDDAEIGGPSCTLVRADALEEVGGFDESFPACEDTDLWIWLFDSYWFIALDRPLYERRYHEGQMMADPEVMLEGRRQKIEKHHDSVSRGYLAHNYYQVAHHHAQLDELNNANKMFAKAIKTNPYAKGYYYYYFWTLFGLAGYKIAQTGHQRIYKSVVALLY